MVPGTVSDFNTVCRGSERLCQRSVDLPRLSRGGKVELFIMRVARSLTKRAQRKPHWGIGGVSTTRMFDATAGTGIGTGEAGASPLYFTDCFADFPACRYLSIPAAILRPSAMAHTMREAPRLVSPPANTPSRLVMKLSSTVTQPRAS